MTVAQGLSLPLPRLTWVRCECGCGWEGVDETTEWLVWEAVGVRSRWNQLRADAAANEAASAEIEQMERTSRLMQLAMSQLTGTH